MNILRKILLVVFVVCVTMMSYHNCIRTEQTIMDVEQFFVRTRTVQAAQVAADRAMMLLEQRNHEYADLKEGFKTVFERLSIEADTVKMESMMLEKVIHSQNAYIVQLQQLLEANQLPVPAQPPMELKLECPVPSQPGGNSFNSQRPTTPPKPRHRNSEAGLSPRNSTVPVAFGMAESRAA